MAAVRSRASANTRQRRVCAVHTCSRSSARSGVHVRSRREMWAQDRGQRRRTGYYSVPHRPPRVKYKAKTNGSPRHNITHNTPRYKDKRSTNSREGPAARTPNTLQIPPDRTPGRTGTRHRPRHTAPPREARAEPRSARCERPVGVAVRFGYDIILYIITKRYIDTDCRLLVLVLGVAAERFAEATALLLLLGRGEA